MACDQSLFNNCPGDYNFETDNIFTFNLLDRFTEENLLVIGVNKYDEDTVKVYNEEWEITYDAPVRQDGLIVFYPHFMDKDADVVNQPVFKNYYLYLNQFDTDTINITYEATIDDCDDMVLKYVTVSYNDSIYFDGATNSYPGVSFVK
jgi:hypothetical protein